MSANVQAIGVAWYKPENYLRLLAIFEDSNKLPRTYNQWLTRAEEACKGYKAKGIRVIRADIDPDKFPEWCRAKGLKINADARMAYANWYAHKMISGTN